MDTRLRHLYESLHGFKTETQKHICDDLLSALGSETKTNLADLFAEAINENANLAEIEEPFISENMLKNRHQTAKEREERESDARGTVRVTDAMRKAGSLTICDATASNQFEFLQREVPHLKGLKSDKRGNKGWIDYIGVMDERPVLGEVKCGSDQNPFYAFIQLLTYLSELGTPNQLQRISSHKLFGNHCQSTEVFDLHILLTDVNKNSAKWRLSGPTESLSKEFKRVLKRKYSDCANLIGRILCLSTTIEDLEAGYKVPLQWKV